MLRKRAKVEHGEYREWTENEGPGEPSIRDPQLDSQFLSWRTDGFKIVNKISSIKTVGTRIA